MNKLEEEQKDAVRRLVEGLIEDRFFRTWVSMVEVHLEVVRVNGGEKVRLPILKAALDELCTDKVLMMLPQETWGGTTIPPKFKIFGEKEEISSPPSIPPEEDPQRPNDSDQTPSDHSQVIEDADPVEEPAFPIEEVVETPSPPKVNVSYVVVTGKVTPMHMELLDVLINIAMDSERSSGELRSADLLTPIGHQGDQKWRSECSAFFHWCREGVGITTTTGNRASARHHLVPGALGRLVEAGIIEKVVPS